MNGRDKAGSIKILGVVLVLVILLLLMFWIVASGGESASPDTQEMESFIQQESSECETQEGSSIGSNWGEIDWN